MLHRSLAFLALGCSLVLLTGCGTGKSGKKKIVPSADGKDVVLHVPEMRERLKLT